MAGTKQVRIDDIISSDRISNFPCNLIDSILSRLPLKDAVRSSILSTFWRHKWLSIPHLTFNREFSGRESIISSVLLRHRGPITKFSFDIDQFASEDGLYFLDGIFYFLSNHPHIDDFRLILSEDYDHYVIPQVLFNFEHLRHLHLRGARFELPSTFKGFNSLVTLTLGRISYTFDMLTFTSKCPMLKFLDVEYLKDEVLACIEIIAPNLETFVFHGSVSSLNLNFPSIKNVSLEFYLSDSTYDNFISLGSKNDMVKVFSQMPSVERMKLGGTFLAFLIIGCVPQKLPNQLNHLTSLDIDVVSLGVQRYVSIVICLIRSSPNLKCMLIRSYTGSSSPEAIQYLKDQQEYEIELCRLKSVEISSIVNEKADMEFVKLLLLWASALEKLQVKLSGAHYLSSCSSEEQIQILQQLASFRRASTDAVIIFK